MIVNVFSWLSTIVGPHDRMLHPGVAGRGALICPSRHKILAPPRLDPIGISKWLGAYFVICKGQIVFVFVGENPGSKPQHLIGQAIIVKDKCNKLRSFFFNKKRDQ